MKSFCDLGLVFPPPPLVAQFPQKRFVELSGTRPRTLFPIPVTCFFFSPPRKKTDGVVSSGEVGGGSNLGGGYRSR